jgi:hypothetical protein
MAVQKRGRVHGTTQSVVKPGDLIPLVQAKIARGRHQDLADVVRLIEAHDLDESFAKDLPERLRGEYVGCVEERRREDEYLARNG